MADWMPMKRARLLPNLVLGTALVALGGVAACNGGSTDDPPSGGTSGTPTSPGGTSKPYVPPTGDPSGPTIIDPTNDPTAKPCTGPAGSLYALSAKKLVTNEDIPLCRFEGSVVMLVNTASYCGNTPQFDTNADGTDGGLQGLYVQYRTQGFYVLGFPSPQFGGQEDDDPAKTAACANEHKVSFPLFQTGNVNPPSVQSVFAWVHAQPGMAADIAWNFEKFIVSRHGQIVKRVSDSTFPNDPAVVATIEAELAKK